MNMQMTAIPPDQIAAPGFMQDSTSRAQRAAGLALTIACLALLVWCVFLLANPTTLPIKQVRIEGEFFRLAPDSLKMMVTDKVRGGFFNLNVNTVRNVLLANPWVQDVAVQRIWPDGLRVTVVEQVAVARWGEDGLLNPAGVCFMPARDTFPEDLPVLHGPHGTEVLVLQRFEELRKSLQDTGLEVRNMTLNERRAWQFELDNGAHVILGKTDFDLRLARFRDLVLSGTSGKFPQTDVVDMRYTNGFAVRWKQGGIKSNEVTGLEDNGEKI